MREPEATFEVNFPICGMNSRIFVKAADHFTAAQIVRSYLASAGMNLESIHHSFASAHIQRIHVINDLQETLAQHLRELQKTKTEVGYEEDQGCFVVKCNGEVIDYFQTHGDALKFAAHHDYVNQQSGGQHETPKA